MDLCKPQKTAEQGWNLHRGGISSSSCLWLKLETPSSEVSVSSPPTAEHLWQQENGGKNSPDNGSYPDVTQKGSGIDTPPLLGKFPFDFQQKVSGKLMTPSLSGRQMRSLNASALVHKPPIPLMPRPLQQQADALYLWQY